MIKLSNKEVLKLYQSDLKELYTIDDDDELIWNENLLHTYWRNFSKFIESNGNELTNLIIPKCDHSALKAGLIDLKIDELIFSNCIFIDGAYFEMLNIKKLAFLSCTFNDTVVFQSYNIDLIEIKSSTIGKSLSFYDCEIDTLRVSSNKVFDSIYLKDSSFTNTFILKKLSIGEAINLDNCSLSPIKESEISEIRTINKSLITFKDFSLIKKYRTDYVIKAETEAPEQLLAGFFAKINNDNFLNYINQQFNNDLEEDKNELIKKIKALNNFSYQNYDPTIKFKNTIITHAITFFSINLKNFYFENSNIEKIYFSNCEWNITNRLIIAEENIKYGTLAENQYRQLKKNFSKDHNWEMSGLAYISEMKMTKRRLGYLVDDGKRYFSKDALEFLVYYFYEKIGGYTQNFSRPLALFLISTFIFFPLTYLFLEPTDVIKYDLTISLEKSISNAFPIIKTKQNFNYWFLSVFQTIFSTILLTFIVLGLRKRFKQ